MSALGDARADRANALWATPFYTSGLIESDLTSVAVGEPVVASEPADGDGGLSGFVAIDVSYVAAGGDALLGQGPQSRRLTLGQDDSGRWWVVRMQGSTD